MKILNYTVLNNQWVKKEIKQEIVNTLRWMKVKKPTWQNLESAAETMLGGDFIVGNTYIKQRFQTSNMIFHIETVIN